MNNATNESSPKPLAGSENITSTRPLANCDQECLVKARILTAMRMALAVKNEQRVRSDEDLTECGLEGVANGAAVEIIRTLGMEPEYVNLYRPPHYPARTLLNSI